MKTLLVVGALAMLSCGRHVPGIEVTFVARVEGGSLASTFSVANVTVASVRGVECSEMVATRLQPIRSAFAHAGHEANDRGAGVEVPLISPADFKLGTVHPPLGVWCGVDVEWAAWSEASGLPRPTLTLKPANVPIPANSYALRRRWYAMRPVVLQTPGARRVALVMDNGVLQAGQSADEALENLVRSARVEVEDG
jgi:hypothetical protein